MAKVKRSYYLPEKLLKVFDRDVKKGGYVREKVVAAALQGFLTASPVERQKMFDRLADFLD